MRILVADDDRVTLQLLSTVLKARGYEVSAAQDGVQALMLAVREPPDAIILDIGMPGGSGLHVLKPLRASTKTSTIPVIVLMAPTDPTLRDQAEALGADDFLPKPVAVDRLQSALDRLLKGPSQEGAPS